MVTLHEYGMKKNDARIRKRKDKAGEKEEEPKTRHAEFSFRAP
jgi:hypothetical protein